MTDLFPRIALWTARQCGKASTFAVMLAFVLIWAATGPLISRSLVALSQGAPVLIDREAGAPASVDFAGITRTELSAWAQRLAV
jgi:hypothetical protein